MKKARLDYNQGQSIIEYLVLFIVVLAGLYLLVSRVPGIFRTYVANASGAMR